MSHMRCFTLCVFVCLAALLSNTPVADAQVIIDSYELTGVNSPVSFVPATTTAPGITGVSIMRNSSLADVSGTTNSFNSMGWNTGTGIVSLGFNVTGSEYVTLDQFIFADRSSATGPGSMDVLFSVDGGAFVKYDTTIQPSATYVDTDLTFAPFNVYHSFRIEFEVTPGAAAANGGAIGSAGSWRISDFENSNAAFLPVQLDGVVTPIPEPSSLSLLAGMSVLGFSLFRKRTKRLLKPYTGCANSHESSQRA
jgi:hypothetical protein